MQVFTGLHHFDLCVLTPNILSLLSITHSHASATVFDTCSVHRGNDTDLYPCAHFNQQAKVGSLPQD